MMKLWLATNEKSQIKDYFRFDGDQIGNASLSTSASTTAVIDDSANTESLTEVSDLSTLPYLFSKMRVVRTSQFSGENQIMLKEMQLFINGSNKTSINTSNFTFFETTGVETVSSLFNNDVTTVNDLYISSLNTIIGDNAGINFDLYFSKYDIETIVLYNRIEGTPAGHPYGKGLRVELLNENDNVLMTWEETTDVKLYYRFEGDRIGDVSTFSSSPSTTLIIDDTSNMETLTEVTDLGTLDYLFSKVRVMRTSNANILNFQEVQLFINGDNKASNTKIGNTLFSTAGVYGSINLPLSTINDGVLSGNSYYHSGGDGHKIGRSFGINFNEYFSKYDMESVVIYNRSNASSLYSRAIGCRIELLNTNDNVRVSSSEISSGKLYYRFDGPRIGAATLSSSGSTTAIINNSSNTESLTEVTDLGTLPYLFSKVRIIRTALSDSIYMIDFNWFTCRELQVFINNENKMSNTKSGLSYLNTAGTGFVIGNNISNINDETITGNVGFTSSSISTSGGTSSPLGLYFGINFNGSYYSKYDIESIVHYADSDVFVGSDGSSNGTRIELLNNYDNVRYASSKMSSSKLYYRMDGDSINNGTISSSFSPDAIIDDIGNTGSLISYPINVIKHLNNIKLYLDAANTNSYYGTGTTWTDLSGLSNNGTLINGPTYNTDNGGYFIFDGNNDYVTATSALSDSFWLENWTISFWVNFDNINNERILLQHGFSSVSNGLHLMERSGKFILGLYGNDLTGSTSLSTNTWYNVTFTLNNTTRVKQIFINGSLDNSNTGSASYSGTGGNARIGGQVLNFGNYFDGKMSSVIAYSEVLTSSQIADNYNAFKERYGL